jgi:hypothetical protein
MKIQISKIVETVEVRDSHVAWCVKMEYDRLMEMRRVYGRTGNIGPNGLRKKAEKTVADSLGTTPGDIILAVERHRQAEREADGE